MEIRRFSDEYEAVAPLYGLSGRELAARDRDRWIAVDRGTVVAAAETLLRPDDRLFVSFKGEPTAASHLAGAVAEHFDCAVHATADEGSPLGQALISRGCVVEMTSEQFEVSFESALRYVRRSSLPARYRLLDAAHSDRNRLFTLDNRVRNLVPGSDGWAGDREWFDDELTDPAAYWIAADRAGDDYVGLARMWRNPTGPRFGLIGVLPEHRRPSPAAALLRATLDEAAAWGYETFTTETAVTNRTVHARLSKLGTPTRRFHQLVLDPSASGLQPPASGPV